MLRKKSPTDVEAGSAGGFASGSAGLSGLSAGVSGLSAGVSGLSGVSATSGGSTSNGSSSSWVDAASWATCSRKLRRALRLRWRRLLRALSRTCRADSRRRSTCARCSGSLPARATSSDVWSISFNSLLAWVSTSVGVEVGVSSWGGCILFQNAFESSLLLSSLLRILCSRCGGLLCKVCVGRVGSVEGMKKNAMCGVPSNAYDFICEIIEFRLHCKSLMVTGCCVGGHTGFAGHAAGGAHAAGDGAHVLYASLA